jgi:protein-tyrosine kinase
MTVNFPPHPRDGAPEGRSAPVSRFAEGPDQGPLYSAVDALPQLSVAAEDLAGAGIYGFRNSDTRSRPFKLLRTQVAKRCADDGLKLIGVTSAAPHVGKSFVASNLAAALSRLGETEVCLVDLDLHRPALARRFGLNEGLGIHDLLSGEAETVEQVARRVNDERMVLIPGFKREVATGELLTSPRGDALFQGLRALPSNTIVLVDMPPIFADDDALLISHRIDAFLVVVEDGRTTRKQVRDTIRILRPTPVLGTVLNRYNNQLFSDEYGYGMSYGYGAYY